MNWEAIGAIAEGLGAFAVLLTLIYLSFQVRDTRKQLMLNAHQARTDRNIQIVLARTSDGEYHDLAAKAKEGEELSDKEFEKLLGHWSVAMRHFEDMHYQYHSNAIDDETWEANLSGLKRVMSLPWGERAWNYNKLQFRKSFRGVVDKIRDGGA